MIKKLSIIFIGLFFVFSFFNLTPNEAQAACGSFSGSCRQCLSIDPNSSGDYNANACGWTGSNCQGGTASCPAGYTQWYWTSCSINECAAVSGGAGATTCPEGQICNPLKYNDFNALVKAVINDFLMPVGITVAGIMFVIAGLVFVTSAGDPGRARTARSIMIYTAVGLAVILLASGLIKVLQSILGD